MAVVVSAQVKGRSTGESVYNCTKKPLAIPSWPLTLTKVLIFDYDTWVIPR